MNISKFDKAYLKMCGTWSELSYCKRNKVGALIVKDKMIISDGYNGTPSKYENKCEDKHNNTHWYVLHAEANAILKCAKNGISCKDATLYITMSPCKECSKLIIQSGIKRILYVKEYRNTEGLDFLRINNIEVVKVDESDLE